MSEESMLARGRRSFSGRAWKDAYRQIGEADKAGSIGAEDLERLANAAYLVGEEAESEHAWARAHSAFLARSESRSAARCAFWLGFTLLDRGDEARGAGWVARAERLLEGEPSSSAEGGFLLLPVGLRRLGEGDAPQAYLVFERAAEIGTRLHDPNLVVLGRLGCGQALIWQDKMAEGLRLLDEAMAAVEAGEIAPIVAGTVYCAVIETCQRTYDLRRAREWTAALTHWCDSQPDLVPFRGQCLVRRAEIMRLSGEWPQAMAEATEACHRLIAHPAGTTAGDAFYVRGELHRLRGEFGEAEQAYLRASELGGGLQPGLALLRLAQGQVRAAVAAIRRVKEETRERSTRARVLQAHVEIMLAAGEVQAARSSAEELGAIAGELDAPFLKAAASYTEGSVLLAEGDAGAAFSALAGAERGWSELQAPYEAARTRGLLWRACLALGDEDTADMRLVAARSALELLGAYPALALLEASRGSGEQSHRLTPRESEVLRLVAAGETNKSVAARLFISERTVERHVSNIFAKIGVSTRAAATAEAYRHRLI